MRFGALVGLALLGAALLASAGSAWQTRRAPIQPLALHSNRASEADLAITGEVIGLRERGTQYASREDLRRLPQVSAVVDDDPDLPGLTVHVSGIPLEVLCQAVGLRRAPALVDALASDGYRAYYPNSMIAAHHPFLVLTMDGMTPKEWAEKNRQEDPGPYLILYDHFKPAWRVLAHTDRPQLPTNVVRVGFGLEGEAFRQIMPRAGSQSVQQGYEIARQNCIRCHAAEATGGTKSNRTWSDLSRDAAERADLFARLVRNPTEVNRQATMPANPEYEAVTLAALTAYFQYESIGVPQ